MHSEPLVSVISTLVITCYYLWLLHTQQIIAPILDGFCQRFPKFIKKIPKFIFFFRNGYKPYFIYSNRKKKSWGFKFQYFFFRFVFTGLFGFIKADCCTRSKLCSPLSFNLVFKVSKYSHGSSVLSEMVVVISIPASRASQ